ncbi:MAG: nuclear transport factor 2 family protein [Bacteroidota bacterium]|nr:nuclear transport factor 2 family protein [Bacteroidota bacterium]
MMTTRELVQSYYDSLNQKDNRWQGMYSDDASFSDASQILNAKGKASVIQSFVPFLKGVAEVKVKQMIADGDSVCAIAAYKYVNPKGQTMNQDVAEVWEIRNEKLAKLIIYFDLIAYRNFMMG